jgi:serine/tyrosine/threonine adenylyltransferase
MLPLFDTDMDRAVERAAASLDRFPGLFEHYWLREMRGKLGLFTAEPDDMALVNDLLVWMKQQAADFTNVFRTLSAPRTDAGFNSWYRRLEGRRARQPQSAAEAADLMRRHNPAFIPRNHLVEEALRAATDERDFTVMAQLLDVLATPYDDRDLPMFSTPGEDDRAYRTFCGT